MPPRPPLTFTCTLCWHPSPPPSHIISPRSARLACGACYAALLDLAVCWVCGELVVRGDECVSLGWCFWHRACYGCLVCGCRLLARGVGVGDVFDDGGEDLGRGKGREVEEVPLCGRCVLEVDGEEVGGRRWEGGGVRRGVARTEEEGEGAEWMDGEGRCGGEGGGRCAGEEGMFYVSMADPMGQPGFRPSRMKPIPVWMHPFRRRDGGGGGQRPGADGLSNTCPRESTSDERQIPGVDGPGSTADSDTSLEHPSAIVEPLRLLRSRPAKLVTANVNGSLSSLGTYHTPPESPLPESKKRPKSVLDVKPRERRETVGTQTEPQRTNPIKHNTSKDHLNLPPKPSRTNQPSAQSGTFHGPRVSKSATPLPPSASRHQHKPTKKPGASGPPSIPVRRSNHQVRNHDSTSKREDNPRVDAKFVGHRDRSAAERASAAEVGRRGGSVVERTSASEEMRMRSNADARERTAARDHPAVVHGLMQDVEVRQVKKPRSMQAELRRLFGL